MNTRAAHGPPINYLENVMVEVIAKNTVQYTSPKTGKFAMATPGARFEMLDAEAESVVRMNAAFFANPQDVVPIQAVLAAPAVLAPETPEPAPEAAHVEPETVPEAEAEPVVAEAPKKTARKAKATE